MGKDANSLYVGNGYDWDSDLPEDADIDDTIAPTGDALDDLSNGATGQTEDTEETEVPSEYAEMLRFRDEQKKSQAREDAEFKARMEEMARLDPDYVAPHVDSEVERVAVAASADYVEFAEMLRADIARQRANFLAGTEGYDAQGAPVVEEAPFDASRLSKARFASFMKATAAGISPERWLAEEEMA